VPSTPGKGIDKPLRNYVVQDGSVLGCLKQNVPLWRQA
jgi:hypothetical protein